MHRGFNSKFQQGFQYWTEDPFKIIMSSILLIDTLFYTLLVCKFLHSGYLKYFAAFLKPRQSVYKTRKSQADGVFLEVPHFATSIYKSSNHLGLSFAYDAPKIWNDLPDDVRSTTFSTHSEGSSQPISTPTSVFPGFSPWS